MSGLRRKQAKPAERHNRHKKAYRWLLNTIIGRFFKKMMILLLWLALWWIAAMALQKPLLLPSPLTVTQRLAHLVVTSEFWSATAFSFLRVLGGILSGLLIGSAVAVLTAKFPFAYTLLQPLIATVKSTPVASFIILVNLWIDRDLLPVFISFLMVFPVVWANVHEGLRSVPQAYLALARVHRFPRLRTIRRIYIPATQPFFLSACRSSLGLAWKAGIAAEVLVPSLVSIGKHLYESKLYLETTDLFAWTIVVIVFSLALEKLANIVLKNIFPSIPSATSTPLNEIAAKEELT